MSQTPVAYIIFNRPQVTVQTFAILRKQRPSRLFIIADGPRLGHPTDIERCAEVRAIVEQVDWPCEVHRNYVKRNLGLKSRVSSGLDWVFKQVDRAIVLEDDCVAHPDFFRFCDSLLERYAEDERVAVVTGNNFQNGERHGDASYYFSKYSHCWGWATWRRAWFYYQSDIPFWSEWHKTESWKQQTPDKVERVYWEAIFERIRLGQIDSWAYPWMACVWRSGGLTATPNVNLVSNIGFGPDSTHTAAAADPLAAMATTALGEIIHPDVVAQEILADRYTFDFAFGGNRLRFPWPLLLLPRRVIGYFYRRIKQKYKF
jgi:hypothetical protein